MVYLNSFASNRMLTVSAFFLFIHVHSDFSGWRWTCALPFHDQRGCCFANKVRSSIGIFRLHAFVRGMYPCPFWCSVETTSWVCIISQYLGLEILFSLDCYPCRYRWQLLLGMGVWWMSSLDSGAISARFVAVVWIGNQLPSVDEASLRNFRLPLPH